MVVLDTFNCLPLLTAYRYNDGSKTVIIKHPLYGDDYAVSYVDYCNKFHGFKISSSRFSYAGQGEEILEIII